MTKLITTEFYKIDPFLFFLKSGNDFFEPLEELQGLQDSLLWSYLFMSLLLLLTHYFLRFALSFSRSRRGLAGLERGN